MPPGSVDTFFNSDKYFADLELRLESPGYTETLHDVLNVWVIERYYEEAARLCMTTLALTLILVYVALSINPAHPYLTLAEAIIFSYWVMGWRVFSFRILIFTPFFGIALAAIEIVKWWV